MYFGSPISEHAARYLETTALGRLLAMSPDENFNLLALTRYRGEFGRNAVYELRVWPAGVALPQHEVAEHHKGRTLFGGDVTYGTLARMLGVYAGTPEISVIPTPARPRARPGR